MHPLMWMILIVLGLYASGTLGVPKRDTPSVRVQTAKVPDRLPMTEAEKHFGCRFVDTTPNGECP